MEVQRCKAAAGRFMAAGRFKAAELEAAGRFMAALAGISAECQPYRAETALALY